jgi:5'(3')-deoxyribonucleotidase
MEKLVGFDLDGVVIDSYCIMLESINKKFNTAFCPINNPMPYDSNAYNLSRNDFMGVFNHLALTHQLPLMPGALETLQQYYKKTKRLVFITHRHNPEVIVKTREFIRENIKLPYELYACYKCEKPSIAKDLGITVFIDDHPDVCETFLKTDIKVYLFTALWHSLGFNTSKFDMVNNWEEIANIIL